MTIFVNGGLSNTLRLFLTNGPMVFFRVRGRMIRIRINRHNANTLPTRQLRGIGLLHRGIRTRHPAGRQIALRRHRTISSTILRTTFLHPLWYFPSFYQYLHQFRYIRHPFSHFLHFQQRTLGFTIRTTTPPFPIQQSVPLFLLFLHVAGCPGNVLYDLSSTALPRGRSTE